MSRKFCKRLPAFLESFMSRELSLGETIRFFRKRKGLSLRELAKYSNVSPIYLSELENGKKINPSEEILHRIVNGLELTQNDLTNLLDRYSAETGRISPDIAEYIMNNKLVQIALRTAKEKGATQQDWINFIININMKK